MKINGKAVGAGCLSVVLVAVVAIVIWAKMDSQRGWTVERLETSIKAEIPQNADKATVDAWFVAHKITDHGFSDNANEWIQYRKELAATLGLDADKVSGYMFGNIDGDKANVGFLDGGEIIVTFFFDKQGRVIGHNVEPVIYSL